MQEETRSLRKIHRDYRNPCANVDHHAVVYVRDEDGSMVGKKGKYESRLKDAPSSPTRDGERHTTNPRGITNSQYVGHKIEDREREKEIHAIYRQ